MGRATRPGGASGAPGGGGPCGGRGALRRAGRRALRLGVRLALGGAALVALGIGVLMVIVAREPFPEALLEPASTLSVEVTDREGRSLREASSAREGRARWTPLDALSPWVVEATIAVEDARFHAHPGVDALAVGRAALANLRAGRVVSGASTLTMQLVRLLEGRRPRDLGDKGRQMVLALRLEQRLSKEEILEHYLNRAPYGNRLWGVEAAARGYFGKAASRLSLAESALLAGLPQAPSDLDPVRHLERARARQRHVLSRMVDEGMIDEATAAQAAAQPLDVQAPRSPFEAPHLVDVALASTPAAAARVETTLDLGLQRRVEAIVADHLRRLEGREVDHAALVVVDNASGEVLAMVGSGDHGGADGQVNGALARRQPGSTLKPFIYALAFERGGWSPATLLADVLTAWPTPGGVYTPNNFDDRFTGPVRARQALATSLNVTAVAALDHVGVDEALALLRDAGLVSLDRDADHYGLGLVLGAGEVRLLELTAAYAMLARGGRSLSPRLVRAALDREGRVLDHPLTRAAAPRPVLAATTAAQITDILSDRAARAPVFGLDGALTLPFDAAVKTGTSSDFRDLWTVGYTEAYTVGVWVGNFDGRPVPGLSGAGGAAPIWRDVMLALHGDDPVRPRFTPHPALEEVEVCALSGALRGPDCPHQVRERFAPGQRPEHTCALHRRVAVDRRTGLLATDACDPAHVASQVIVDLPPLYDHWRAATGQPLPPHGPSPLCSADAGSVDAGSATNAQAQVTILRPLTDTLYVIDPQLARDHQRLTLEATAVAARRVRWRVDGQVVGESARPFQARWRLEGGRHAVEAEALDEDGATLARDQVMIEVLD